MNISTIEKNINLIDLIKNIPVGFCIYNIKSLPLEFIFWNDYMTEITGYTLNEINELGLNKIFCDSNLVSDFINRIEVEKDYEIISKNGSIKTIQVSTSLMTINTDESVPLVIVKDVTKNKESNQELMEIQQRYEKILELSTDSIFIHADEKFVYVNKNTFKMFGINNPKDIIGQSIYKYIHPSFHEIIKNRVTIELETKGHLPIIEETFIDTKGELINVEVASSYVPYKGQKCIFTFIRNISNRKTLENQLRESELMLRQVTENCLDMITIADITGNIQYGTPSNKTTLGYDLEDFIGINLFDLVRPEDLNYAQTQLSEMIETSTEKTIQCFLRCKDGSYKCIEIRGKTLTYDNTKKIIFCSRDISKRVKVENALKESEKLYKQLIELLPFGVYVFKKDKIILSNKVGLDYLGVSSFDVIKDKSYLQIVKPHPSYLKNHKRSIKQVVTNKYSPLTEEKFIRVSDNKILDFEAVVTKYPYEHKENTYLIVLRDISDRKKAEELEEDMKEKSRLLYEANEYEKLRTEFFANLSHELRTPINVILSSIQLLDLKVKNISNISEYKEEYKKYPAILKQNCYRLLRLINNLIDVTRIDSGYFNLNLINANIITVVEDITLSVVDYTSNKGISLTFDTNVEERILSCDPEKIERIILNLISNAVKFTEPGGNILVNLMDNDENITISVKDTGIGISNDKLNVIFDRFVQVDKSLTRNREGSGIGLSLVKSLVEMHKGTITVKSELNEGSEFIITLPCYLIDENINTVDSNSHVIQGNLEKTNIEFSDIYY
jgi:PAS domain S-box-containing protein